MSHSPAASWLALMIGNSRLHWAEFRNGTLHQTWHIPHLSSPAPDCDLPDEARDLFRLLPELPLYIASVVPSQTERWQVHPSAQVLRLEQVPLKGLYPTLGIDRALAVWGASRSLGFPVLVIDAGTALTFTAADEEARLVGGAIVAGLQTQWRSLAQNTAALPVGDAASIALPERWGMNTPDAIRSGIIYTLLASIRDYSEAWLERFPGGAIGLTGGDGEMLFQLLQLQFPELAIRMRVDANLIFWGMEAVCFIDRGVG
jgi:type III pantothenate kinase